MTTYYFFHNLIGMTDNENETTYAFWMALSESNRGKHNLEANVRFYGR